MTSSHLYARIAELESEVLELKKALAMTEPMGELTNDQIERLWMELRQHCDEQGEAITHILEPLSCAHIAGEREKIVHDKNCAVHANPYLPPPCDCGADESQFIVRPTTASPGDEELIERLESSCSPYEATKRANLIHEAAARLRSLADEKAEAGHAISSLALELRQKNARIAELEKDWEGACVHAAELEKLVVQYEAIPVEDMEEELAAKSERIAELEAGIRDQQEQYNLTKVLEEEDTRLRQRIATLEEENKRLWKLLDEKCDKKLRRALHPAPPVGYRYVNNGDANIEGSISAPSGPDIEKIPSEEKSETSCQDG